MTKITLYHPQDLSALSFPDSKEGQYAKNFLTAFMSDNTTRLISNIDTQMYCLKIDNLFFPITVNNTEYNNSYVTSPFGIIAYAKEELRRMNHRLLTPLLSPVLKASGGILRWGKVNRVVTVNNWLLSTNLYPKLSKEQVSKATSFLQEEFPSHSILWRSLNNTCPINLLDNFKRLPCRLVVNRQVYFYDPQKESLLKSKQKWNIKNDRKLLQTSGYQVINGLDLSSKDIPRIRELYKSLYLDKYTLLNPQFTDEFILLAIEKKLLNVLALRKDGVIDGVVGYFSKGNVMTTPLFGYDTKLSKKIGLYRMLTSICIKEAHRHQLKLHHSSGAAHFKRVRGMQPDLEYTAVFDQHLPARRRLVWRMLAALLNKIGRPILTHFKL